MDESVKCECGNTQFLYFWDYARCPKCFNEYKTTGLVERRDRSRKIPFSYNVVENWVRRYNTELNNYTNWEKVTM